MLVGARNHWVFGLVASVVLVFSSSAMAKGKRVGGNPAAGPVMLQLRDFEAAVANLNVVIDGFEGLPEGLQPSSTLEMLNGTYIGNVPIVSYFASDEAEALSNDVFRTTASGAILSDNAIQESRTFTNFPDGTTYWGVDLIAMDSAEFDIVVVGNSGILVREKVRGGELSGFLGVHDSRGLISISIATVDFSSSGGDGKGLSNYYLDDIITAGE